MIEKGRRPPPTPHPNILLVTTKGAGTCPADNGLYWHPHETEDKFNTKKYIKSLAGLVPANCIVTRRIWMWHG